MYLDYPHLNSIIPDLKLVYNMKRGLESKRSFDAKFVAFVSYVGLNPELLFITCAVCAEYPPDLITLLSVGLSDI